MHVHAGDGTESLKLLTKNENKEIVIFGASVAGEALYHVCNDRGMEPSCFCDNNRNKTGKKLCGIPILHPLELKYAVERPFFLISAADIGDVTEQLEGMGYHEWLDSSQLLQEFDAYRHPLSVPPDFAEYVISSCVMCHQAHRNPKALFLRCVDIVITERCSLRCKDCANLMQYYQKPKDYSLQEIVKSAEILSGIVDAVNEIRVIGGEPLMNPVFSEVVGKLIDEPKFRRVIIYSNGTICPPRDRLQRLQHPKVLFFFTHYPGLSQNLERLVGLLDELKIQRFVQMARGWHQCSSIRWHERDPMDRNCLFHDCCAKHLVTLMNGHLYRCPFTANATNLRAIPHCPEDSVRILGENSSTWNLERLRDGVLRLLSRRRPLDGCDYCEGRPYWATEIEPAIQTPYALEYQKFPPGRAEGPFPVGGTGSLLDDACGLESTIP